MKKFLLSILLFFSLTAAASGDEDYSPSDEATHFAAIIWVKSDDPDDPVDIDEAIADLEASGITILHHREDLLLAYIPVDFSQEPEDKIRRKKGIKDIRISKPKKNIPTMHIARGFNNAAYIHEGYNLPSPYDGTGVVIGICDIGFDTRHVNFLDTEGECRIRKVVHYIEEKGERNVYSDPEAIYDWETDNIDDWHATHVAGIAAGGTLVKGEKADYHGMAPNAELVFTASQLSDVGLLGGVEDIIEYAQSVGKPAVINLSVGNYLGPHDGTSLFSRYLDLCADEAVICISAGNEGDTPRTLSYDFTESKPYIEVRPNEWAGTDFSGTAEVWSKDATPFDFTFFLRSDTSASYNLYPYKPMKAEEGDSFNWRVSAVEGDPDFDSNLAEHYYDGYVAVKGGISPLNGKYCVELEMQLKTNQTHGTDAWAEYWPGIGVKGDPGSHVDIFAGSGVFLRQASGSPAPDNNLCISDLATGFKTISVGMMNTTDQIDDPKGTGPKTGEVNIYSSYGKLGDGRKLPITVAPGATLISSINGAYVRKQSEEKEPNYPDFADYNGERYYYTYDLGTSMSCPYVAGTIATWLQAYPRISPSEVRNIVLRTNQTTGLIDPDNPRHGQGWLEPYNGLTEVLSLAALNVTSAEMSSPTVKVSGRQLIIGNPEGKRLCIEIYNTSGTKVSEYKVSGTIETVTLSELDKGIYIIRVGDRCLKTAL